MEKEFINLINDHRALIFKVCNIYCHETETRRDMFQEVVLQLWRSFPGFKRESSNSTWIYKVALNTAISNFRKETKRVGKSSITALEFEIHDMSFDPDSLDNSLQQAINKLNDLEKAIIMLYLDENSYEEMSEILGLSTSNIGVRINRIKKKLTKILKTY